MKYQDEPGQPGCKQSACGRGEYSPAGSTSPKACKDCEINKYRTGGTSMTECEPVECTNGAYAQAGAFAKDQCVKICGAERPNTLYDVITSTCQCNIGFFSRTPTGECEQLPDGVVCSVPKGCTPADFQLRPGLWRTSLNSSQIMMCPVAELCAPPASRANTSSACAPGHTGTMCTVCADGWGRSMGLHCAKCEGGDNSAFAMWLALFLLVPPFAYAGFRRLNLGKKLWWENMKVQMKIVITFMQVLSQIHSVYDIPYTESFVRFVQYMALVNLDLIDVLRIDCIAHVNFYDKLVTITLLPIVVSMVLFVVVCWKADTAVRNTCVRVILLLTFIIFPSVSTTVLRAFSCRDLDNGSSLLKADYSIDCNAPDRPFYVVYAVIMTLIYPIGITALYAMLLWKQRVLICPEKRDWRKVCGVRVFPPPPLSIADFDAQLVERETMLSDKSDNDGKSGMLRSTHFLFNEYEPRFWWFEVFECVRRLMVTGGTVFFLEGSSTQVAAGMLVALFSTLVYTRTQPYIRDEDDKVAMAAQLAIYFTLFIGLLLKAKVPSDDGYDWALGGLLIFVNAMVIALPIFVVVVRVRNNATDAAPAMAEAASAGASSSAGSTTTNPTAAVAATSSSGSPHPECSSSRRKDSMAKHSKRANSSAGSTTTNPTSEEAATSSSGSPLAKGGGSHSKDSKAEHNLSKRPLVINATTNPATQGDDSEPKPTALL
jgi:hypothetical protein